MINNKYYKKILINLFEEAVKAADPFHCMEKYVPKSPPKGRTIVIGAGKASARMAKIFEDIWISRQNTTIEGLVVTRYGHEEKCKFIDILSASHPIPNKDGLEATKKIIELVSDLTKNDLVVFLVSGGGSALLICPKKGISFKEKQVITRDLLKSGATISEINCVRKHLSDVKGGNLASVIFPAKLITLAISDVPGDDPGIIASGPTVPDETYLKDAKNILNKYNINCSSNLTNLLNSKYSETPKKGSKFFLNTKYNIIARPQDSLSKAASYAKLIGFRPIILSDSMEGESNDVGVIHGSIAKQAINFNQPFKPPLCILSGGETTVTVKSSKGKGGRNSQFLLSLAIYLNSLKNIYAIACDTDGVDGVESNAGAIIYPDTLFRGNKLGLNAKNYLSRNDAYNYFRKLNDLVITGPTKTNVNDFRAILVQK